MKKSFFIPSRAIHKALDKPNIQAANDGPSSFGETLALNNRWQNWNSEVAFSSDAKTTIQVLAQKLSEQDNFYKSQQYEEIITKSLEAHVQGNSLSEGVKISTLWEHLMKNGCDALKVKNGCLAAYKDGKELKIAEFLKPEPCRLIHAAREVYEDQVTKIHEESFTARMAFVSEASNLPPFIIS